MHIEGDSVIFSTGRRRYANNGIIGIAPDMEITEGSDGGFYRGKDQESWRSPAELLTTAELLELADYMIEQWQQFRAMQGDAP